MYKIKVLRTCRLSVIIDNKEVVKTCNPDEDVMVKEIFMNEIKGNLYRPYRNNIVKPNGEEILRKRPEEVQENASSTDSKEVDTVKTDLISAVNSLQNAMSAANNLINKLDEKPIISDQKIPEKKIILKDEKSGIPDSMFINEGEISAKSYSEQDYNTYHNRIRVLVGQQELNDNQMISISTSKNTIHHLPKFANMKQEEIQGEININDQDKGEGQDILDMTPVNINVIKDEKGKINVVDSLGIIIVNGHGDNLNAAFPGKI